MLRDIQSVHIDVVASLKFATGSVVFNTLYPQYIAASHGTGGLQTFIALSGINMLSVARQLDRVYTYNVRLPGYRFVQGMVISHEITQAVTSHLSNLEYRYP